MRKTIRVVVPNVGWGHRSVRDFEALEDDGLILNLAAATYGPDSIEGRADSALAAPAIIGMAIAAEREGAHAVVVDCLSDPGVEAARECVRIPVVGPLEAACHLASTLAYRFSIVTVFEDAGPFFAGRVADFGLREKLASIRGLDIPVRELGSDPERTFARMAEEALKAIKQDGAHAILFGCGGLARAQDLGAELSAAGCEVPVIEPMPVAIRWAALLVDLGLAQSGRTYPRARAKPIVGYDDVGRRPG